MEITEHSFLVTQSQSKLFANLILEGLKELETDEIASADAMKAITDEQLEEQIGKTDRNGLWELPVGFLIP